MRGGFYMKKLLIGASGIRASEIALGCMRINAVSYEKAVEVVTEAIERGIDYFDHADVYAKGEAEVTFGRIIKEEKIPRDKIYLQSKCGICDGFFDFSKEHILESVEGSLSRLQTDYLDVLLLHRPDALVEPEEVAEAFSILHSQGKVRYFGVSNHNAGQIALLRKFVPFPIVANQLQFSVVHSQLIGSGLHVNMLPDASSERDGEILDYCRLHDITMQAWSPFHHGFFTGIFLGSDRYPDLNRLMQTIADSRSVSKTAIAIAWILRHPAGIQPVVGTMNLLHLQDICEASNVILSRKEWYAMYVAAGNILP